MKIGIIRCQQTEDTCPGTIDFIAAKEKKSGFEAIENPEIIGFVSCGGCPGKKAVFRAQTMVDRGAEIIMLASCIFKGSPIGFPCPYAQQMKEVVKKRIREDIKIIDFTH